MAERAVLKFQLDGCSLTPEQLVDIGYHAECVVSLSPEAWARVRQGRAIVDNVIARQETVYGINTGFGNFANVKIAPDKIEELQLNLIRSHAAGVGQPITPPRTRMLLALRINVLAKGHSGISEKTLHQMIQALNANCLSVVPAKGTVGASGDLAPLAHLALGLIGEGLMWDPDDNRHKPAGEVLKKHGLKPLELGAKEGLALINGTQLICTFGAEAIVRAKRIARQADCVTALTLEVLKASSLPFHPQIHSARPHRGQKIVAGRFRALLNWGKPASEITESHANCGRVQDAYTLRCTPQIHGIVVDTIGFVYDILTTELNSATDNPMIFVEADNTHSHVEMRKMTEDKHWDVDVDPRTNGIVISGGNFHGEYPAKVMDFLTIAVHELGSVSERRIERLVNPQLSGLPAFLVKNGGLNSGYMIAHCTAAALVSENKTLSHPASVDSLSTSAAQEDHVSMGGFAARKALKVVGHVETIVAIELLCACQALDLLRPLKTTESLEKVYNVVRSAVPFMEKDRYLSPDIQAVVNLLREERIWQTLRDDIPAPFRDVPAPTTYNLSLQTALPMHESIIMQFPPPAPGSTRPRAHLPAQRDGPQGARANDTTPNANPTASRSKL